MPNHRLLSFPVFISRSTYSVILPPLFRVPSMFCTIQGVDRVLQGRESSFANVVVIKLFVAPVSMSASTFRCVFPSLKTWRKMVFIRKAFWVARNTLSEKRARIQVEESELIENPLPTFSTLLLTSLVPRHSVS